MMVNMKQSESQVQKRHLMYHPFKFEEDRTNTILNNYGNQR